MKKLILTILLMSVSAVAFAQYFTGFSIESYRISSVWPTNFRSVAGSVTASIGNTGDIRAMSGNVTTVYRNGKAFAHGNCEDVSFYKGSSSYVLNGVVELAKGISIWDAISAALAFNANEYTIDFSVDITHPYGKVDHAKRAGIPLVHYFKR